MAAPFPLSDRASDVRPGCKTQRIAPTLRQVADLMCARIKEREYFKTCIVGHVNCCLQCAPTLTLLKTITSVIPCVTRVVSLLARQRPVELCVVASWHPSFLIQQSDCITATL
ncbi:hypothetical protein PoB_006870300 [Plakobranchus ocellatus]|uniref:Uncharacterized protein n=1 Tax=Plakobranchus ocellatus TaxID=259542 RepID=A0AAV4DD81_9GAST|nr:hypothetical protein PoB_006870300 [Plakobranchus ocellatus]